ncbi:hypothetical protein [Luteolibacter luteus]|uniref:PEP-CTERM sorting domain-containing protein n=1 Tax=Luteolibacter luteus TaxID=2728835 RepID=A0A858RLK7_9BACT|nr:hypothetical protein [Luteolibacter luteus]QJE97615.1 hypothetical protein HHL09_18145 [Luteolibacter luteus]
MKLSTFMALALACAFTAVAHAANIVIGTGTDTSYFVLESPNVGTRTYEIHYTYNSSDPMDSWDLLQIVDSHESDLSIEAFNFGSEESPNWFVNAITWNGSTETGVSEPPYSPSWTQWVSGGQAGFPSASPIGSGTWSSGSGLSIPYRVIEPGSWDALKYSDFTTQPTVTPVPEPSMGVLALAGGLLVIRRRKR